MFGRKTSDEPPAWCLARLTNDEQGVTGLVRFIERPTADQKRLKTAIEITWTYAGDALPDEQQNNAMNAFERAIDALTEDRGTSQMAYVRTAFGRREWLIYVRDRDAFMAAFNACLAGAPQYPIEIAVFDDPKWRMWREFVDPIIARADWERAN